MRSLAALCACLGVFACRGSVDDETRAAPEIRAERSSTTTVVTPPDVAKPVEPAKPATITCDPATPAQACDQLRAAKPATDLALAPCSAAAQTRVGEWSYALVAPLYETTESMSRADLATLWSGDTLQASAETHAALASILGASRATPVDGRPDVGKHWAIVPAHELISAWKVIAIDDKHPLADAATQPLAVPLCTTAPTTAQLHNIDPQKLTVFAMTGTTAMTRMMGPLLDHKGTTYPARDVASWFAGADFVHVSNEVSFVPDCKLGTPTMEFCSREPYIELLEAIHTNVIELTGSHLSDYGTKWISHTLDMYAQRGWHWFGGGHDQVEGTTPLVFDHHGNHFALVGCNMVRTTSHEIHDALPDTAACDLRRMDWQIRDLRAHGIVPLISIQHEEVYVHDPPDVIVSDFRHLAETGAAFVFGSQAHCAHPWEVHDGAFIHYGAGNFFFDQEGTNTRDGTVDRLYLYDNKLLTVGHLFTRLEENGRPRPLTDRERTEFLGTLVHTLAKLPHATPWAEPKLAPPARQHADSFVLHSDNMPLLVYAPPAADASLLAGGGRRADATARFPLVIYLHKEDLRGGSLDKLLARGLPQALATQTSNTSFVASPHLRNSQSWTPKLIEQVTQFMIAKYPIDPAQVTIQRE